MKQILHILNKSPFSSTLLQQCLERCDKEHDAIIFLEDGVYNTLSNPLYIEPLTAVKHCYAIKQDIVARGLDMGTLLPHIQLIDYSAFVELTTIYRLNQSWY